MANEITYSSFSGDQRIVALLNQEVYNLLYDPTDLRAAITRIPFDAVGSAAVKVPQLDIDYAMAAPGETTAATNTAFVDASTTLTVARYALMFSLTDLMQITAPSGHLDVAKLARIVADTAGLTFTDLLTALFGSVSNDVGGGAGVDFSVDYFYDGIFQLQQSNASAPFSAVLAPNSVSELMTSIRGETGALEYQPATADQLMAKGPGYRGSWMGVDIWQSDSVVTATGTKQNCMFDRQAFIYTEAPVSRLLPQINSNIAVAESSVFVTVEWDDQQAEFRVIGNYYPAVAELEDARACLISSDD